MHAHHSTCQRGAAAVRARSRMYACHDSACHICMFACAASCSGVHCGKTFLNAVKSGMTTTLKKPGWLFVMPSLLRSMSGDTGRFAARSASPCRNISSCRRRTHSRCTARELVRWPRSATLSVTCSTSERCSSSRSSADQLTGGWPAPLHMNSPIFVLNMDSMLKCCFMSVPSTASMTCLRSVIIILEGTCCRNANESSDAMMRNEADRWWCSIGDWSLYSIARLSAVLTRKSLLTPRCAKSCTTAARIALSRPWSSCPFVQHRRATCPRVKMTYTLRSTSAACTRLWYGLSR
mmetsp:Transcript_8480/g.25668  ORF Transcript_8480/g.25668 Transcript_8480/m.25668 type:complete len:293 (+) Transcript_8480:141-1019(+)